MYDFILFHYLLYSLFYTIFIHIAIAIYTRLQQLLIKTSRQKDNLISTIVTSN